jgi:hypothetical protein
MGEEKPAEIPIEAQPQGYFDGLDTDKYVIGLTARSKKHEN